MQNKNNSKNKFAKLFETEESEQEIDETLDESFPASATCRRGLQAQITKANLLNKIGKRKLNSSIKRQEKVKKLQKMKN